MRRAVYAVAVVFLVGLAIKNLLIHNPVGALVLTVSAAAVMGLWYLTDAVEVSVEPPMVDARTAMKRNVAAMQEQFDRNPDLSGRCLPCMVASMLKESGLPLRTEGHQCADKHGDWVD